MSNSVIPPINKLFKKFIKHNVFGKKRYKTHFCYLPMIDQYVDSMGDNVPGLSFF